MLLVELLLSAVARATAVAAAMARVNHEANDAVEDRSLLHRPVGPGALLSPCSRLGPGCVVFPAAAVGASAATTAQQQQQQ